MGFIICYKIVKRHGTRIKLHKQKSDRHKGSRNQQWHFDPTEVSLKAHNPPHKLERLVYVCMVVSLGDWVPVPIC